MSADDPDRRGDVRRLYATPGLVTTLTRAAWLAILLGLGIEGLMLFVAVSGGSGTGTFAADLVENVSWSVFVCVGLAVGTAAVRARIPLMGLLGLLSAPVAFEISRALHKGIVAALSLSGDADAAGTPILVLALIKGVEYGCLGVIVGWVGNHSWGGAAAHAAAGLAIGFVFGGLALGIVVGAAPGAFSVTDLFSRGLNELLFPVGCSLVLYSARVLAERSTAEETAAPNSVR